MSRCCITLRSLFAAVGSLLILGFSLSAPPPALADEGDSHRDVDGRPGWTTSQFHGTPDPPPPYVAQPIWPELTFDMAVDLVLGPDERIFVVERLGKIWSFDPKQPSAGKSLFADLQPVFSDFEKPELYSIAFHPDFRSTRSVFVRTRLNEQTEAGSRVHRFQVVGQGAGLKIDSDSEQTVLTFRSGSHSGGNIAFGPDGYLYITTGDARPPSPPDALRTGQDITDLEASILRIDVDVPVADAENGEGGKGPKYLVPPDNPFADMPEARGEVYAFGLRNPWKICFHPKTGRLWCADVGWEQWEMIYQIDAGGNYGWSITEGPQTVLPDQPRGPTPIQPPLVAHPHTEAASITGGYFYQGDRLPELRGAYLYGDFITGRLWGLWHDGDQILRRQELARTSKKVVAFGRDATGEVFFADWGNDKPLLQLVANPEPDRSAEFPRRLSETGLTAAESIDTPAAGVFPYDVAVPQWRDGASSDRWVALPGRRAVTAKIGRRGPGRSVRPGFPDQTVLARTFSVPQPDGGRRRIETQVLHRHRGQWQPYTYRWNETQNDAELVDAAGATTTLQVPNPDSPDRWRTITWRFHSRAECVRCHNDTAGGVLGFLPGQLAVDDQLEDFHHAGIVDQKFVDFARQAPFQTLDDPHASLESRARSWLHANCASCHRFGGGGSAEFMLNRLLTTEETRLVGAAPQQGTFGLDRPSVVVPGAPHRSTLMHRLAKQGAGRMPQLGTTLPDPQALRVIRRWIASLDPADSDAVGSENASSAETNPWPSDQAEIDADLQATSDALRVVGILERTDSSKERSKWVTLGMKSANPEVRSLFDRFLPDDQRRDVLGLHPEPQSILRLQGAADEGREVFRRAKCTACHKLGDEGVEVGPPLAGIGLRMSPEALLDSVLSPSKTIDPKYQTSSFLLDDGRIVSGVVVSESDDVTEVADATGKRHKLDRSSVVERSRSAISIMPEGLLQEFTAKEAADLLAFLRQLN